MGKKTANNAIDFARLFAVKEKLGRPAIAAVTPAPEPEPPIERVVAPVTAPGPILVEAPPPERTPEIEPASRRTLTLRIGMSSALHERIRVVAALRRKPSTVLVRELLEALPPLEPKASLSVLAERARAVAPIRAIARPRIDVRMQVAVTDDLVAYLHQMAALRAQTLGACLVDVLESELPVP